MNLDPIQMLWVRGDLSRMELLSIRSFLAHGHPVHLYTYVPPQNTPTGTQLMDASPIVPAALAPLAPLAPMSKGSMGSFSDYFRYHLLSQKGGWWSDMDVVALKPWSGFPNIVTASTHEPPHGRIANGFVMRFPPDHPVPRACARALNPLELQHLHIGDTGPLLLHRILGSDGVATHSQPPEIFSPIPWNAAWQLLRPLSQRFTLDELKQRLRRPHLSMRFSHHTVAVHLWNEMWRLSGWDKNARHAPSCLYEQYQRRWNP